jgi:hypothetical protein
MRCAAAQPPCFRRSTVRCMQREAVGEAPKWRLGLCHVRPSAGESQGPRVGPSS